MPLPNLLSWVGLMLAVAFIAGIVATGPGPQPSGARHFTSLSR